MASDILRALRIPEFRPPFWLRGGHLQTVAVPLLPPTPGPLGERIRVPIPGGGLWAHWHRRDEARECVVALHGIVGTGDEGFVVRTARLASQRGMAALRLSLRGAGLSRECGHAPLYHAGLTDDVRAVIAWALQRYARVHLVGFSLGGQIVLRTLGEWGDGARGHVASVTAISPPLDLSQSARYAELPAAWPYRQYIVRALKARFDAARAHMGPAFASLDLAGVDTIRGYDAAVVAPYFGFADVEDYYARAASLAVLDRIRVPTLILHADDDPLVPSEPARRVARADHPFVRVVIVSHGGHVGFLAADRGAHDETRFWAEQRALDLADATRQV